MPAVDQAAVLRKPAATLSGSGSQFGDRNRFYWICAEEMFGPVATIPGRSRLSMKNGEKQAGTLNATLPERLAPQAIRALAPGGWQRFSDAIPNFFPRKPWRSWRSWHAKKCAWTRSRAYSLPRPRWQSGEPSAMPESQARGLRAKANSLWFLNQNQQAVELYEQAIELYEKCGNETEVGRTLSSAIQPLIRLGEYDRAVEWAERARQIFSAEGRYVTPGASGTQCRQHLSPAGQVCRGIGSLRTRLPPVAAPSGHGGYCRRATQHGGVPDQSERLSKGAGNPSGRQDLL